jgi:hypothetical protein
VQPADRSLFTLGSKLNLYSGDITDRVLERLHVLAEEDLLSHKVNDVTYTAHVALTSINKKRVTEHI